MNDDSKNLNQVKAGRFFQRVEKKYLITHTQKKELLELCADKIQKNKYFTSTVCNLYFDTENDDLIINSIEKQVDKPIFKEKVRLRSYNIPKMDSDVFLEIKTKYKEEKIRRGYKRRIIIKLSDFYDFLNHKSSLPEIATRKQEKANDTQIAKELEYLFRHFKLVPKIIITYMRTSYEDKDDNDLRITFDEKLKYRTDKLKLEKGTKGKKYFSDKKNVILEIKVSGAMPLWLVHSLNKCKIYPQPFSKYGKIYQQIKGEKNV